ncbi:acetate--CoA ligase family protein [Herbiconiux sp. 11R-BC]|uniref:acetate--CoA ligase family protein n=1 Tax=Herbiconiux sp. 11R-BC TaxID=3111637 RepID=UPI003C0B7C94
MTVEVLAPLFAPRGILVLGASTSPDKLGAVMARSLSTAGVPLALVNPRAGVPGFVATVAEGARLIAAEGGRPDLAVLCVPAAATPDALTECAEAGVRAALVCSGGFGETGEPQGIALDEAVQASIAASGLRLLGPNTSGFFAPARSLIASFVPGAHELPAGDVAVVASSGGVNHLLSYRLAGAGLGLSLAVGLGAGLDVDHAAVLEYLADDEGTRVIALHLESTRDGEALLAAVRRASARKPVVALVVGRGDVSEFAQSHTGALATSWRTTRSVLRQAGAVLVDDEDQLVAAVAGLRAGRLAAHPSPGVALVTGQAGPGLLIADALAEAGVRVPRLSDRSVARLGELLPPLTFQANPVDTGRPGPGFSEVVRTVAADASIELVGVYGLTEPVLDMVGAVGEAGADTPVIVAMDGPASEIAPVRAAAAAAGLPFLTGPSALARALAAVVEDARIRAEAEHQAGLAEDPLVAPVVDDTGGWDEPATKALVAALGIPIPPSRVVALDTGRTAAHAALDELGAPIAVKLVDAAVLHKTELGGVHLGISDHAALDTALDALESIGSRRVLLERMAPGGVDLIVGVRRDPVFGPIVLVGLGGVAAEASADVAIRSVPLTRAAAEALVRELRGSELLFGWRGGPVLDIAAFAGHLAALGALVLRNPWIDELELNPVRLTVDGIVALDAVLIPRKDDDVNADS